MNGKTLLALVCGLLTTLSACDRTDTAVRQSGADNKPSAASPRVSTEDALRHRAETFWKARMVDDWAKLYEFQEPAYRAATTLEEFLSNSKQDPGLFRYSFYELGGIELQGDLGWIRTKTVGTLVRFPDLTPQNMERVDTWRRIDGDWYPAMAEKHNEFPEPPSSRSAVDEGWLAKRFQEYWEARKNANYPVLYQFLNPEDRERITFEHFADTEAWFSFLDCQVRWVEVIGERGRVAVIYTVRSGDPHLSKTEPLPKPLTENWIKVDNVWYRDVPAPPKTQKE